MFVVKVYLCLRVVSFLSISEADVNCAIRLKIYKYEIYLVSGKKDI
jgi:hypothetical protein